jgi:hypothetical protein
MDMNIIDIPSVMYDVETICHALSSNSISEIRCPYLLFGVTSKEAWRNTSHSQY